MVAAEAFNVNTENLITNRTTIQRQRKEFTEQCNAKIKWKFYLADCNCSVLHWDRKLLPALRCVEKIVRSAVFVTFHGKEQLLGIPEIPAFIDQALTTYQSAEKWIIEEKSKGCVAIQLQYNDGCNFRARVEFV